MPYEVDPSLEVIMYPSRFQDVIRGQIAALGDCNHPAPDRYNPQAAPRRDFDYHFTSNGNITFGEMWQTHRMDVGDLELIYAYKPQTIFRTDEVFRFLAKVSGEEPPVDSGEPLAAKAELYVEEFNENGLVACTSFREYQGSIYKGRTTRGSDFAELSRPLSRKEAALLETALVDPEAQEAAWQSLVALTRKDERHVKRARKDQAKRKQEYHQRLEDIAKAQHATSVAIASDPTIYR